MADSAAAQPLPLAALQAEEAANQARMDTQFTRFSLVMAELKKQLSLLAAQYQQEAAADPNSAALAPLVQQSYLLFLELKAISRQLTNMAETTKTQLNNRKKRVDALNLQCESVLYERSHFLKEIAIAADFHSKHVAPELVDETEFARAHPEAATLNAHETWRARLQDEQQRREELLAQQRTMESRNDTLAGANDEMRLRKKRFNTQMKEVYTSLRDSEAGYFQEADVQMER